MRLNVDLIRDLLFYFEEILPEVQPVLIASQIELPPYTSQQIVYHVGLLYDDGYINANYDRGIIQPDDYIIFRLSSRGHEFLEGIRNDTLWNMFKEIAKNLGIEAIKTALPIIANILAKQAGFNL